MRRKAAATGRCGVLLFASSSFADPSLTSAHVQKACRFLQIISSQLEEVQETFGPRHFAQAAAALASAEQQVRIDFVYRCHTLYAAQLKAAKTALVRRDQNQALQYL